MSPKTKVAPIEPQDGPRQGDAPEITAEEYPEWHALATEAMAETPKALSSGGLEPWVIGAPHGFKKLYGKLDRKTQSLVDAFENYPRDPRLVDFGQKGRIQGVPHFRARVNENYRALALQKDGETYGYWVGIHVDCDRILKSMAK